MSFLKPFICDCKYEDSYIIEKLSQENVTFTIELAELKRQISMLRMSLDAQKISAFYEPLIEGQKDSDGRIRTVCMRFKCNQPLLRREYQIYNKDRPLFCAYCSHDLYNWVECEKYRNPDSDREELIKKHSKTLIEG